MLYDGDNFGFQIKLINDNYLIEQACENAKSEPNTKQVEVSERKMPIEEGWHSVDELPTATRSRIWQVVCDQRQETPFELARERGMYVVKKVQQRRGFLKRLFR